MNKKNNNQNLISDNLKIKYVFKKAVVPSAVIIVIAVIILILYCVGTQLITKKFNDASYEYNNSPEQVENQSLMDQNSDLDAQLSAVDQSILDLAMKESVTNVSYQLHKLVSFLISNKPDAITITSLEDYNTLNKYSTGGAGIDADGLEQTVDSNSQPIDSGSTSSTQNDSSEPVSTDSSPVDVSVPDGSSSSGDPVNSASSSSQPVVNTEVQLKFETEVGNYPLVLRGFTTDKPSLLRYVKKMSECEFINNYSLKSVEANELYKTNLYVFEVLIYPKQSS